MIKSYRDLDVWQEGLRLVNSIYQLTNKFPKEEVYSLTSQMRRSALSIPSNIAEGFMRQHTKEMIQFLYISLGSCGELDTQISVAENLGYLDGNCIAEYQQKLTYISKMIRNLIKSLQRSKRTNH